MSKQLVPILIAARLLFASVLLALVLGEPGRDVALPTKAHPPSREQGEGRGEGRR